MADSRTSRVAAMVAVAAVVNGATSYVVLVLVARALSAAHYADFLAFWGAIFFGVGMLTGVQGDITRGVSRPVPRPPRAPRVLPLALLATAVAVAVAAAFGDAWAPALVPHASTAAALVAICGGILSFAGHAATTGVLGGSGRWRDWSMLVAGESIVRLALVAVLASTGTGLDGFMLAVGAAATTWIWFLLVRGSVGDVLRARSDRTTRRTLAGWRHAVTATACSSLLVVGFPVLVRITASPREYAGSAALLLALMLTRGPILLPLGALQNVLVARISSGGGHRLPVARVVGSIVAAVVLCGGLGALLGPWVLRTMRPGFHVDALVFAQLGIAAVLVAVITFTGAVALALDRHGTYAFGWVVATVAAIIVLAALPLGIDARVVTSLLLGPALGIAVHVAGMARWGANVHARADEGRAS